MNGNKITEEEIQYEVSLNILEEQRYYLIKYIDPQHHFAYLRSKHLFTLEDEELVKSFVTRKQQAEKFLDILLRKGPNCYKGLVNAILKNGTQTFLVTRLNKEYEKKKIHLHNLLTGSKPLDPNANIGVDPDCLPRPTAGLMAGRSKSPMENSSIDPLSVTSSKSSCNYCDESNI
ncbi:B-cell lymphoma/leukemia 10-like [Crassostrea virginica]